MALIKPGPGITDIRGKFGGVHFHRNKSGLCVSSQKRMVHSRSSAQSAQRNAFREARTFATSIRSLSYNTYRALNGLPMQEPPADYRPDLR